MKIELDEGRVYGARYYTVHPVFGWDLTHDWGGIDTWDKMMSWCVNTFGPSARDGTWTPNMRWYANNAKFWFRTEQDRDWFLLRWS